MRNSNNNNNKKKELPFDPAILLLGIYLSTENHDSKDTCIPMFFAPLYTIAKKMWYIYTVEYYLAIKRKEIMTFAATWIDLNIIMLSEVRQ